MGRQWIYGAALSAAFIAGWLTQGWRMGQQMAEQRAEHIDLLRRTAEANAQIILQQQADQQAQAQRLAELDTKHTQELSHALQENRRLEDLYSAADDERRRLRIDVIVARNDAVVSETTGAGSMGDAASLELSADSGRSIWDIRRGMIEDRAKLEYLQEWVRALP
ncbi:prophage endopeptidase [Halopseudomonas formosensis]|uniref:Prophage endopeptidase n=2 Tax=Halopseudomonas formosensis TaxID=1002526 RepID=A0A1I6AMW4_9GAMM|nr:prophage endopeptidase [Halopseudomonas formosensis]